MSMMHTSVSSTRTAVWIRLTDTLLCICVRLTLSSFWSAKDRQNVTTLLRIWCADHRNIKWHSVFVANRWNSNKTWQPQTDQKKPYHQVYENHEIYKKVPHCEGHVSHRQKAATSLWTCWSWTEMWNSIKESVMHRCKGATPDSHERCHIIKYLSVTNRQHIC